MITEDKVRAIHSTEQLLSFMHDELDWQLPPQPTLEEVTFDWTGAELNLSEDAVRRLKGGVVRQLRPFKEGQPWGVFLVEFADSHVYRTALRQILRRLVPSRRSSRPDLPSWHWENLLFICTTKNQEFTFAHFRGEKPERARLITFSWEPEEPIRTLCEFNLPPLRYELGWDNQTWLKEWHTAFDVEKVTDEFFNGYMEVFKQLQGILSEQISHDKEVMIWAHDYSLQFLNRLMFLYFIQKKRWLGDNPRFIRYFWDAYRGSKQAKDTFFENWLKVLFFEAFNNRYQNRAEYLRLFGEEINEALSKAPYLNGGLFSQTELDSRYSFNIPDEFLEIIFEHFGGTTPGFFERYNFTISETTPLDQEVAVDPEMIGKVYEKLVNLTFEGISEEDLRGGAGIFYTPRVEIDLMCRLALVDYLTNHLGNARKPLFYQAVFAYDPKEKEEAGKALADEDLWGKLDELLQDITVLDPACGSGSFLVGMLLVLDDLIARADSQLGKKQTRFERRKEIIANSLYGVDVMPWAVHTAELRLWLQLTIETELKEWEGKFEPMLPNLSFKVRPGDSLVQEVGGINFGLQRMPQNIPSHLKGKLTQLKGEKLKFYRNDPTRKFKDEETLKLEERNIFREILHARAQRLENEIKSLTQRIESPQAQVVMPGMEPKVIQAPLSVQQWREERRRLTDELGQVQKAKDALHTAEDIPFIWDIAFVEIFRGDKNGFDIVIGNPPYVRQENIEDPQGIYNKGTYNAMLQQSAYATYPTFFGYNLSADTPAHKIDGRCDYYVFFYLQGLNLLNEKGSFCFITSNSWLDVGYGKDLQEFLLKHCHIKMILDNEKRRSFAQSGVNTIIALFSPPDERNEWGLSEKARFVMFKVPFEEVLSPVIFQEIEEAEKASFDPKHRQLQVPVFGTNEEFIITELSRLEFRVRLIEQADLYEDGLGFAEAKTALISTQPSYTGNKWGGKYLRAPEIFWTILEKGKNKLVGLANVAEMRRGFTTGANDFFYLQPTAKPAPKGLVHVRNSARWEGFIEEEFLKPVAKTPREIKTVLIQPEDLKYRIFMCHLSKAQLKKKGKSHAFAYIRWGEKQKTKGHQRKQQAGISLPEVSSFAARRFWYAIEEKSPISFLTNRFFNDRLFFAFPEMPSVEDQTFYGGIFHKDIAKGSQIALLNSTVEALFASLLGRVALGEGVLQYAVYEMGRLIILEASILTSSQRDRLAKAFDKVAKREIKSIFEELGLPKPNRDYSNINLGDVSLDKVLRDRRQLDKVVFEALELTENEQLEVYRAVVELVKNRLVKAGSV